MYFIAQNILLIIVLLMFVTFILAKTHHNESSRILSSIIILLNMSVILLFVFNGIIIAFLTIIGYLVYIVIVGRRKYYDLRVRTKYIESTSIKNNFRALYVSDFQFDQGSKKFNHKAMRQVVDKIKDQEYDILFYGGDYVNYVENIDVFFNYLKEIQNPKMGTYAVLGNHDYIDYDRVVNELKKLNINVVENSKVDLPGNITIAGVEDEWYGNPTLVELNEQNLNILLTHNPDFIKKLGPDNLVDFALAGHYHAGQVNLLGIPVQRLISKYVYGFYNDYSTKLYVSSGVGGAVFRNIFTIQMRYFAQPELVEIVFISKEN
jgi:predicted MPP superfamily phosphohydrolase